MTLWVNGKYIETDVDLFIEESRTLVPFALLAKAMKNRCPETMSLPYLYYNEYAEKSQDEKMAFDMEIKDEISTNLPPYPNKVEDNDKLAREALDNSQVFNLGIYTRDEIEAVAGQIHKLDD